MSLDEIKDLNLKANLLYFGLNLSKKAIKSLNIENFVDKTYYTTTSGILLKCFGESDFWLNASVNKASQFLLDLEDDIFFINFFGEKIKVEIKPLPYFYNKNNSKGIPYKEIMSTQADRVNIFPIVGCSYSCKFCPISYTEKYTKTFCLNDYIEAIHVALSDSLVPAKHIQITGGVPKEEDFHYFREIVEGILREFINIPIDLMMAPKKDLIDLNKLKLLGLNGLAINMELYGKDFSNKLTPNKFKDIGREGYLDAIEDSVKILGRGKVRSILLVGLEPLKDTLKGVEEIAKRGADIVLSPFFPDENTPLKNKKKPSVEFMKKAYIESRKITDKFNVKIAPRCHACQHNTLAIPY